MLSRRGLLAALTAGAAMTLAPKAAFATSAASAFPAVDRPAIFYAPHADDETISFGVDIANHLIEGRSVIAVLVSQGASDWMLQQLNGDIVDEDAGYRHDPVAEAYLDGRLTLATVGAARIREFHSAVGRLSMVVPGRGFSYIAPGGEGFSVDRASVLIRSFAARYPGASHKTMSWSDRHPDHSALGTALRDLYDQKVVTDARWYCQPKGKEGDAEAAGLSPWRVDLDPRVPRNTVDQAANAYRAWNPAAGAYRFGYKSSGDVIDYTAQNVYGLTHAR